MTVQEDPGRIPAASAADPAAGCEVADESSQAAQDKEQGSENQPKAIDFVTMAMFIIGKSRLGSLAGLLTAFADDIEFLPPTPPAHGVPGGAATYAALGARLVSPPPQSYSVGWVVDMGTDFPSDLVTLIDSWETSAVLRENPDRLTTRAWNGYGPAEKRDFKYLTPKRRLHADDIPPHLLSSKSFHLVCSPARCQEIVADLTKLRKRLMPPEEYARPFIIWEPVPDKCVPDELLACTNTLPVVDICSPNHTELAGFMADDGLDPVTGEISTAAIERHCEQLLGSICLQSFTLVVRAAEKGCFIARNGGRRRKPNQGAAKRRKKDHLHGNFHSDIDMEALFAGLMQDEDGSIAREEIEVDAGVEKWIPPYHQDSSKVVDPTGAGNTFLGGLAVALARGKSIEGAVIHGTISASFAVEQVGLPTLGHDEHGNETWNGERVDDRLDEFQERLSKQRHGTD
ncbi:related to carbohydrate kinase MAK32 protein [Cephalotrichum gorgonifer]|uniref:Related to carbohydrate kinase MAK32 protein n=1 Tax=Cephalotrichum gorgonifer TaxID=2041049 RepID=A0AAE8SVE5_9PEZI|nr:related to carbohydrate kinase MAK32 protein [Cephalotrichum gorgonifer]